MLELWKGVELLSYACQVPTNLATLATSPVNFLAARAAVKFKFLLDRASKVFMFWVLWLFLYSYDLESDA